MCEVLIDICLLHQFVSHDRQKAGKSNNTCMNQHSHQLSASHDELGHHVHIVVPARAQLGWGLLTRSEALIQLQAGACDKVSLKVNACCSLSQIDLVLGQT